MQELKSTKGRLSESVNTNDTGDCGESKFEKRMEEESAGNAVAVTITAKHLKR